MQQSKQIISRLKKTSYWCISQSCISPIEVNVAFIHNIQLEAEFVEIRAIYYRLRSSENFTQFPCRTSRFQKSFFSICYQWLEFSGPRCLKLCFSSHF